MAAFTSMLLMVLLTLTPVLLTYGAKWSYRGPYGPHNWASIDPVCNGTRQSPINIESEYAVITDLGLFNLQGYESANYYMDFDNNGHGVTVRLAEDESRLYILSGAGLPTTYVATQFHFHWGSSNIRGSEHTLNGRAYPAELHMVHYATRYDNLVEALTSGQYDAATALGFFIEVGPENNDAFDNFLDYIDEIAEYNSTTGITRLGRGNLPSFPLRSIMPEDLSRFYRYGGSLTIPNCYETVIWNVFEETIKISQEQLEKFRSVYGLDNGTIEPTVDNFRPTLPRYGRVIYYSRPESTDTGEETCPVCVCGEDEGELGALMTVAVIVLACVLAVVFIWGMFMTVFYITLKTKHDKAKNTSQSSGKALSALENPAYQQKE